MSDSTNHLKCKPFKPFDVYIRCPAHVAKVEPGTFIVYDETGVDGETFPVFGRVLAKVVAMPDGTKPKRSRRRLLVLVPGSGLRFGYTRIIDADMIAGVSGDDMPFLRWFVSFRNLDHEQIEDVIRYGALNNNYIDGVLGPDGEIDPEWRARQ